MKKLLTCLALLSALLSPEVFCMKKKGKKKKKKHPEQTISQEKDHAGTKFYNEIQEAFVDDLKVTQETAKEKLKEKFKPKVLDYVFAIGFSEETIKTIVNSIIDLKENEQSNDAVFVPSLYAKIKNKIGPNLITEMSIAFSKEKTACSDIFHETVTKIFTKEINTKTNFINYNKALYLIQTSVIDFVLTIATSVDNT